MGYMYPVRLESLTLLRFRLESLTYSRLMRSMIWA